MLKAEYTLSELPHGEAIKGQYEEEFETIGELEHFLAYNRAYITRLQFWGSFRKEVEE